MTFLDAGFRKIKSLVPRVLAALLLTWLLLAPSSARSAATVTATNGYRALADLLTATAGSNDAFLPLVLKDYEVPEWEYEVSECLPGAATAEDRVDVYVQDGDVVVDHHSVIYNCCAQIDVRLIDARPLFQVVECETFPETGPCRCECPYEVNVRIRDLVSGRYRVEVLNCDHSRLYGWGEVTVP